MRRLFKPLFWCLVFLVMLAVIDQVLVRLPPIHPAHASVITFYRDFRDRLFSVIEIVPPDAPQTIEAVIDSGLKAKAKTPAAPQASTKSATAPATTTAKPTRYVYADQDGVLQFADSLGDVPAAYRAGAQPLEE